MTLLDAKTGATMSSLRSSADLSGKTSMGMSSVCPFPEPFSAFNSAGNNTTQPAIAYGGNSTKKGDNYAMLISIRNAASPPILHWKCRLPEPEMSAGLMLSRCGHYVVGGGASGSCYVWSSLGGKLLRRFQSHYRACSCLDWSDCGRYLVTGGDDGMVHLFSLIDLVDIDARKADSTVSPWHTFSVHHFPVTSLAQMPGGRMVSAALDGQVLVLELFSKSVLMDVHMPHGIRSIVYNDGRIYLGSIQGTIYSIDTSEYTMHQTERLGAVYARRRRQAQMDASQRTMEESIFGKNDLSPESNPTLTAYQTDWVGHDSPVTAIALLTPFGDQPIMISGDEFGQVRIWDLESRTCLNILQPWSQSVGQTTAAKSPSAALQQKKAASHPVTCIRIVEQPDDNPTSSMFRSHSSSNQRNATSVSTMLPPLQKFVEADALDASLVPVPFLAPNRTDEELRYWEATPIFRKKRQRVRYQDTRTTANTDTENDVRMQDPVEVSDSQQMVSEAMTHRIKELEKQLQSKQSEVDRWEKVNNKLMAKLQAKK